MEKRSGFSKECWCQEWVYQEGLRFIEHSLYYIWAFTIKHFHKLLDVCMHMYVKIKNTFKIVLVPLVSSFMIALLLHSKGFA